MEILKDIFIWLKKYFYFCEVGQHFYWTIFNFQVHGQVLINSWIVILIIVLLGSLTTRELKLIPGGAQSFIEFVTEFVRDIAKLRVNSFYN
jgi:F-type H+-transporting ATPase subunit a